MSKKLWIACFGVCIGTLGCGGASTAPQSPAEQEPAPVAEAPAATPPAEAPPAATESTDAGAASAEPPKEPVTPSATTSGTPWAKQDRQQRIEYMAKVVMPEMKKLFQTFDANEFASFGCKTCHGEDFKKVDFKMPNTLHPLPTTNTWAEAVKHNEKAAMFMKDQVQPTMAKLLGREPYSATAPTGFGCFNCHKKAE